MPRKTFKKIITSPELIEQINPKNKKLIELFLKDKTRKCSAKTIENYHSDLNIFFCWVIENAENKFYPDIKKFEISDFFSFTTEEDGLRWSGKRFARMRSVLSSLSDCVIKFYDDDYPLFRNFVNSVIEPIPKTSVREKTVLNDEEIDLLIKTLKERGEIEQVCFLALAIYSGCRIAELEQFRIDSIDENNTAFGGVMLETTHKIRCKGFGKEGHKIEKYVIKDLFLPYYYEWINLRKEKLKELNKDDEKALFINTLGEKASQTVFRDWTENWEKIVNKPVYMHCFRHRFVTDLLSKGLSRDYVIAITGWKTDMTQTYNDLEDKDKNWKDSDKLQQLINQELKNEEIN